MKTIALTRGKFAKMDDDDFEFLNQWKWIARLSADGRTWYVGRYLPRKITISKMIHMHKVVMHTENRIDHKNGDGLDNQNHNLRECTHQQNLHNIRSVDPKKTCPYKGVCLHKTSGLWRAYIKLDKQLSLGYYRDPVDAAYAYDRAAMKHFGEFANLNFPGGMS